MYSKKPDISSLNQMASETNNIPLPHIPENPHILLPPPEHSLIRNNFQVFSEDLANMLNNPNFDFEEKNKLDDLEVNSVQNKGKSRQSIIGIKRHTDRNTERLSITSNFKKRKTDLSESNNDNFNMNINKNKGFTNLDSQANKNNLNNTNNNLTSNKQGNKSNNVNENKKHNENNINRKRLDSENNLNEEDENKSDNQEFGENDYINEEGDVDEYDQMDNQSENSEGNFGLRDEFNHSDMGDYL